MYKPWIYYRVRSYFIFFLFLILEILQKSELLPWFELKKGKRGGRGGGIVQHACMYISEPFLNVKAVNFWEVLNFFCFPFFLQAFCSELLLYIADNLKEYKNMWSSFKKNYSIALVQYTKRLW